MTMISFQNQSVRFCKIRRAIGDPAKSPRVIQTVQGRGFRLIADIEKIETPYEPLSSLLSDQLETELLRKELWAYIKPRELSLDQQRAIGNALRPFSGQKVTVFSYSWDPEGCRFSDQIGTALRFANLAVIDRKTISSSKPKEGVVVLWWLTEDLARNIGEVLSSLGNVDAVAVTEGSSVVISPDGKQTPSPDPVLNIFVGPKPPPVLQG